MSGQYNMDKKVFGTTTRAEWASDIPKIPEQISPYLRRSLRTLEEALADRANAEREQVTASPTGPAGKTDGD